MIDTGAEFYFAFRRVVDQLDGDEGIARQLQHGQVTERCPLDGPGDRVADGAVERE
jgi:hypothetical protein